MTPKQKEIHPAEYFAQMSRRFWRDERTKVELKTFATWSSPGKRLMKEKGKQQERKQKHFIEFQQVRKCAPFVQNDIKFVYYMGNIPNIVGPYTTEAGSCL